MSKSLQKGILFAVCILLVCALGVTLFIFDGTGGAVTGQEGQASNVAQNTTSYTHGSNIGRQNQTSGTPVGTAEALVSALKTSGTYHLTNDINLNSSQIFKNNTFSGTLYGNGYTITLNGKTHSTINDVAEMYSVDSIGSNDAGALISKMQGGKVYDLNIQASGDFKVIGRSDDRNTNVNVGLLAGWITGGSVIDNVSVTLAANSFLMAMGYGTPGNNSHTWHAAGLIGGVVDNNNTITNITATVNGIIDAGTHNRNDQLVHEFGGGIGSSEKYTGVSGAVVGKVEANTTNVKIDNIIVAGSGQMRGACVGLVAFTSSSVRNSTATVNIFNKTTSDVVRGAHYWSYTFLKWDSGSSWTVNNYYRRTGAQSDMNAGYNPQNTINVSDSQNVYFDPKQGTNYANSLAVVFNQAPAASYKYTLVAVNGAKYDNDKTISNAIVFRNLPTAAATWNSGGNFTAVLESEFAGPQHRQPDLQPYEHGYTTGTPSGTPINDGSQFEGLFSKTGSVQPGDKGTYYLTKDIVITGFTGKQFAGTLDGNGHTIYIAASETALSGAGDATSGFAVGGLVGVLTGTIKNVRVVIDADITVGLDSNKKGRIGGVVGRLNGGTLDNVQVVIPSDVTISHNTGGQESGMGGVVGQALGASSIQNVTVQMDGTLAPVGNWTFVSALVAEVPTANGTPTIDMDNIIIRGAGTFDAEATGGGTDEPPYVSALANFNNQKGNEIVNLDGLIYDFKPTISGGGASAYGIFVNNWSKGDPDTYGAYVTTSNMFQMFGKEYKAVENGGKYAGNAPVPLDGELKTINTSVTGVGGATVAAYFMPGTGLVRLQVHSDSWGDERLTISGVEVDGKPIMSSLATAGDSSSDRYFSVDKSTLSGLGDAVQVQVSLFSNVTDPVVQGLTYTGSPLDIVIDMSYNGAPLTAVDYSLSGLTASGGNALVQDGKPLNAGEYSVTVTLNNPDHWFGISGSGEASKTANVTFTVSPKNVTMQAPDSMTAVYGEKYWILSNNNVWGLDENLFFDEVVGNVEYTATVTRTDDGEGYASASGWLKAGSYTVALTINDSNYAINGNASVEYPLTITPVELSYTLTVENSVAAVYDGNVRTISGTPQGGDGIISAALEGSAGTAGDSVTAAVSVTYGGVAAQIQNAGDYVLGVALSGDDAENYTAMLTASWTEGGAIENNTVTVEKADYDMTGVTFENASFKYDGTEKTITVSGTLPTGADDIQVTVSYSGTNGTALTNAGSTEITATFATTSANYNEPVSKTATLTITPVTLTINDISGNYTDYTAADIVIDDMVSGILEGDTEGVTITPAWDTPLADEDGWLAANTYNATLSLGGDKAVNYTFGSDNVATVTVSPFDLSGAQVTITSAPFTYNGNEQTVLYTVLTGEGGKDITSVLTPTGNTQTNAGDNYTLTLTGGSNFTGSATVNWSIAKKNVTFAWSVSGEIVEGMAADEVKALATETNNGGILEADKYTFGVDIGDYSESTLQGTAVTFTPSVTFTEEGDAANYNITFSPETAQLTVQSGEIAIEVTQATVNTDYVNGYTSAAQFLANFTTSVSEVTIDESEFSVTVTPKDGGAAVGFGSLLDVGEYKVTLTSSVYSLAGTLIYDYVVTATQWTASVAAPEGGLTYDGTDKLGSLVVTPGDNAGAELEGAPEIAAYVEGGMVNANAYTVTLRLQTAEGAVYEGGNFILAAASAEIEIAKRVVEISWAEDTDLIYNGTAHTLTATADFVSGESIDLNSLIAYTGDVTDGSAINAGSYTATITKAQIEEKNANYTLAAESVTQEFTISRATLTLTQAAGATLTRPYDGMVTEATSFLTEKYVTITGGVSGENIYGMLNAELTSGVEIKNAGRYVITVTFNAEAAGAGNYSVGDFTSLKIVYEVTAKTITITFSGYEDLTYDGQAHTLTATADFVSGENIDLNALIAYTGDVTDGSAINAGDYTATITKAQIVEQNANYTLAAESATQEFTISPATLTLTQADGAQLSRVYDGTVTEAGAFVSETYFTVSGYVDGGNNVYALFTAAVAEGLTIQNADSYTINITLNSGAEGAGNYTCEPFAITYEVTPIQWTASVTAPEGGLTYDGENKLGSLVPTPGDNEGTDIEGAPVIVATVTGGSMVNAGTYTVTLQLQTDGAVYSGGNYELTAESAKIVIAKRVVEIIWAEASDFTYNGLAHTLTATVNNKVGEDEVNATVQLGGDNVSVTEEGFTYTVTGLEGTAAANYTIEGVENLTSEKQHISRATLTVQFEGITDLVYKGTAHTVTATATGWQNSEDYNSTLNGLITIGGADTQVLNAGDYTATITKQALEAELGNYTLAQDATADFTVQPETVNVTVTITGDGVVENELTWSVADAVTVDGNSVDGWTLTSGGTSYTVTVTGADGVASDVLQLTLNGAEYKGTPYGTRVEAGKLGVASTDPNYKVEVTTPAVINIQPDISIEIRTGADYPITAEYDRSKTYSANDFANYFYIDSQPEGSWTYSVDGTDSNTFGNVGVYTVRAEFTILASDIRLKNSITFTVTQATVTGVVLNGDGAYTYGDLKADSTISVTVTYSDDHTATVNAGFTADMSTGGYVKAGESVVLTLTGDYGENANYAQVDDSQTVTVSVSKAGITADIYYEDIASADGVLTLTYNGKEGYVVSVKLTGVLDGDVVEGKLETEIVNAKTYGDLTFALHGDDSYVITNAEALSVVVTPAEITVEWSNFEGFTYDGTAKAPTATAKGTFDSDKVPLSVTVTGDNATEEGQAINAGDYTATVAAFVSGNYKLSADSVQSFSIAKATATLGIDNYQDSVVYNAGAVTVTPTVNGAADTDGIVNVTIAYTATGGTEAVSADEIRNAGSYTVTLQISGAPNYEDASQDFVITVNPAELTVTTAKNSFTYGDEIDLGATVNAISGDDVSAVIDRVEDDMGESAELKNAGSYTVTYRLEGAAAGNYTITAGATADVTVNKREVTVSGNDNQQLQYNGAAQVPEFTLDNAVEGDEVLSIAISATEGELTGGNAVNVGAYTATVSITNPNYTGEGAVLNFRITAVTVTANAVNAVYGDILANGNVLQNNEGWRFVIHDGAPVDVTVTLSDGGATARAGETYLGAGEHTVTVTLVSGNYTFAGDSRSAESTLQITPKQLNIAAQLPEDLTYTSEGIVIGLEDYASQLVGDDEVTVSMLVDGEPYVAGVTVLGAGEHTVTVTMTDTSDNYLLAAAQQTFTVEKKEVTSSITVSGETIENNSSLEIVHGENARVQNAIDNYLTQNGVEEGEYTLTVTNSAGQAADLDNISAWAPGTYTVNLGLSDNFEGGMTFTIVVQEGTTAQIPDAPVLPSTPLEDGGSSGVANWLFPLIIAIECLIAIALIVAIAVSAARRSKNS